MISDIEAGRYTFVEGNSYKTTNGAFNLTKITSSFRAVVQSFMTDEGGFCLVSSPRGNVNLPYGGQLYHGEGDVVICACDKEKRLIGDVYTLKKA